MISFNGLNEEMIENISQFEAAINQIEVNHETKEFVNLSKRTINSVDNFQTASIEVINRLQEQLDFYRNDLIKARKYIEALGGDKKLIPYIS